MKPLFISCSVENIKYRGYVMTNNPVNLSWCKSVEKRKYSHYPDNEGIPSIKFLGCDVEWVYDNKKLRDEDFNRILTFNGCEQSDKEIAFD